MVRIVLVAISLALASAVRKSQVTQLQVDKSPIAEELGQALHDLRTIYEKVERAKYIMVKLDNVMKKPSLVKGIDWDFAELFAAIPEACERTMGQLIFSDLVVFGSSTARIRNLTDWLAAYKYHVESADAAVELAAKDVRRAAAPGTVDDATLTQDKLLGEAKKLEGRRVSELLKASDSVHTLHVLWSRVVPEAERLAGKVTESAGKCRNSGSGGLVTKMKSLQLLTTTISDSLTKAHSLLKDAVSLVPGGASMLEVGQGQQEFTGGCPVVPEPRQSAICERLDRADHSYHMVVAQVERVELQMAMIMTDLMDVQLPATSSCKEALRDLQATGDLMEEIVEKHIQVAKYKFAESRGEFPVPTEGLALPEAIAEAKALDERRWEKVKLAQKALQEASREFSAKKQKVLNRLVGHMECDDDNIQRLISSRIQTVYKTEDSLKAVLQIFDGIQ